MDLEDELRPRRGPEQGPTKLGRISEIVVVVVVDLVVFGGSCAAVGDAVDAVRRRRRLDAGEGLEARRQREKLKNRHTSFNAHVNKPVQVAQGH